MKIIGYARVSTAEQADSRAGLEAQRAAIEDEVARRGHDLVSLIEDAGYSAKNLKRPGIQEALSALKKKEAEGLVVAKLDRLSRSLLDFAALMELARHERWSLIALDLGVDTSTPSGEMMASVLATFAQFERRLIGQRTKDALAVKRAQGVILGRPLATPAAVVNRIATMRAQGFTFAAIADALNHSSTPTSHGGKQWHPSTVHSILRRETNGGR
jgi:DNA invertase Pin-like site-specific DNA recombinase